MKTEIGEYIVGSYLKIIKECDVVDYNVRPPGGGIEGLNELDVLGFHFKSSTVYLCEVTTHIQGLQYGNYNESIKRISSKHAKQKEYAKKYLKRFKNKNFMLWSPVVPVGSLSERLLKIKTLDCIINGRYKSRIDELRERAKKETRDAGNPFFRTLQILEHLRTT